jgi:hypothetical protein
VPAVLRLDHGQVVARDDLDALRGVGTGQQLPVDGCRVAQPADVLMQDGLLERQLHLAVRRDQRPGGVQVALRGPHRAQLLVDRRPAHQHVGERVIQAVPARDPGRLVQQPLGRRVGELGPLGPRQRPQGERQRLGRPRPPHTGDQSRRDRVVPARIRYDAFVYTLSVYHEVSWGLCFGQRIKLPLSHN